mgnify:CR=1 FL=1
MDYVKSVKINKHIIIKKLSLIFTKFRGCDNVKETGINIEAYHVY